MLDLVGLRIDHLISDRYAEQVKQVREHNHQPGQDKEDHRRIRNLVPYGFDAVEQLLQKRLRRRGLGGGGDASLLTHACASSCHQANTPHSVPRAPSPSPPADATAHGSVRGSPLKPAREDGPWFGCASIPCFPARTALSCASRGYDRVAWRRLIRFPSRL